MKYKDLALKSELALRTGLRCILDNTLPSYWDNGACGWHEQWMNADYCGVYAGCEGVILLSQARQYVSQQEYKRIIDGAYSKYLCVIFDENVEIREDEDYAVNKLSQRNKALFASYKLAKFLWASSYVEERRNLELEQRIAQKLYSLFDRKHRQFKTTRSAKHGSVLATVFSYIALKKSGHIQPELEIVEEYFLAHLNEIAEIEEHNIDEVIFIIWAIAQNLAECRPELIRKSVELLAQLVNNQDVRHNLIVGERYNIRFAGIRDNFSINKFFVFIQSIQLFIQAKHISTNWIRSILSEVSEISATVLKNEVYSRDGRRESVLFWENYYALQILNDFTQIVNNSSCKEDNYMVISPKLFKGDNYTIDDNLCVVIMPFRTEWSTDIYETFKEAVGNFDIWRSDEEYGDDIIIQTIWEKINRARFVIADCTGRNPNVFYELGIAHTLGKSVFLCSQNREDFPFDVNHIRSFEYGLKPGEIRKLKNEIGKFIKSL